MANHGFVHLKTRIDAARLEAELQKINQARFKGKLKITRGGEWGKGKPLFEIEFVEDFHILFWLDSPWKIEYRHGPGGDFRWWIESVFANDLAVNLKGMLADEGCDSKWKPEKDKYPTFLVMLREQAKAYRVKGLLGSYLNHQKLKQAAETRPDLAEFLGKSSSWWSKLKAKWSANGKLTLTR